MAATDLERLVVQLDADLKKFTNAMQKAQGVANKQLGAIEKRAKQSSSGIALSFARSGAAIISGLAAGRVAQELLSLSEAATRIDNSLKVAGLTGGELEKVYERLSASAKANGAPIETLAALYGKAAQSQKELGVTSEELLGFTNNVALALRVAGTDAQTASGALLQLGQALGSGKVQAEEFNSILEGAPTIAQAAAAGLKEAGGSVSQLKKLVVDGKISSEAFFRAFEAGAPILEQRAANATFTVAQAATNLNTALIDVVREFNNATGASKNFAGGVNTVANAVSSLDVTGFIDKIRDMRSELDGFLSDVGNADIFTRFNEWAGIVKDGMVVNVDKEQADEKVNALEDEVKLLQERIALNTSLGFDNTDALARLSEVRSALASLRTEAANMPETVPAVPGGTNGQMGGSTSRGGARKPASVTPVSIADFKAPVGSGGRSGGSGGKKQSDYQREVEQIKERTAAIQAETTAQAQINPLIDDYGYAIEKARAEQDLLAAAQKAGLAVTPELKASISALAEGYAQASASAEQLQVSQDRVRQAAEDFKSTAKDITSGFISDLRDGVSMADALRNALNKVVDKIIEIGLNAGFGFGGSGGGLFGGIFSLLGFKNGGEIRKYARGGKLKGPGTGRSDSMLIRASNGEFMVNAAATKKHRALLEAINSGNLPKFANGGAIGRAPRMPQLSSRRQTEAVSYSPTYTIDARGADQAAVARLERGLAERDRTESKRVSGYNQRQQVRKTRP